LKKYSCQLPPEIASHGVPTVEATNAKPVCGAIIRSDASTTAACSSSGRSKQSIAASRNEQQRAS
jgi:hypothetical protein